MLGFIRSLLSHRINTAAATLEPQSAETQVNLSSHRFGQHTLLFAAESGDLRVAKRALDRGADPAHDSYQALRYAAARGHAELVQLLIDHGSRIDAWDHEALRFAAENGHQAVVKILLQNGAEVDAFSGYALRFSSARGDAAMVRLLLDAGAEVCLGGCAAAKLAISHSRTEVVKVLLDRGASRAALADVPRPVPGRRAETHRFVSLADRCLLAGTDPDQWRAFCAELGLAIPPRLKTDAFLGSASAPTISNIASIMLSAAYAAAHFGAVDPRVTQAILSSLIETDVKRIESTKGLSYRKYAGYLRSCDLMLASFSDVIHELTEALTLPELAWQQGANADVSVLFEQARQNAIDLVIGTKSTLDLARLSAKWHQAGNGAPIELRPLKKLGEWHPLFEPIEVADGYLVRCLTNAHELEYEGRFLKHCVGRGGYTSACQDGGAHIVTIRDSANVPLATLELRELEQRRGAGGLEAIALPSGRMFRVQQFKGARNTTPGLEASAAWSAALQRLCSGIGVKLERHRGLTPLGKRNLGRLPEVERICGYKLKDFQEVREKLIKHYDARIVITRGRRTSDIVKLLQKDSAVS